MKRTSRLALLLGVLGATSISLLPAAFAQEAEPGVATELMDGVDVSLNPPMPPQPFGGPPEPPPGPGGPDEGGDNIAFHGGGDVMMLRAGVHSDFTDEQLEQMYKAKNDFLDKAGPKMVELKSQERALHDLLTQPDFDKSKAMSLQSKINSLHNDLANMKLEQRISLLNTLTAEQRKELRKSYIKMMDFGPMMMHGKMRHHGWGHRSGGGGGGGCSPGGHGGPGGHRGHHGGPGGEHKEAPTDKG